MAQPPLWRRAFDTAERAIGAPLESAVQTEAFADLVSLTARLQAAVRRRYERNTRRMLHLFNLPAGSDVKRLHEQIWALQRQVRDLSKRLEDDTKER